MSRHNPGALVWATVACSGLFEIQVAVATQIRSVRAHSPWRDDPYNAIVYFAQVTVPVLAALLVARLASRRRSPSTAAGDDGELQLLRVALAALLVIDATLGFEWGSVMVGAHKAAWGATTVGLVAAAAAVSSCALPLTVLVVRAGAARRLRRGWNEDWLGDITMGIGQIPGLGRINLMPVVRSVRRHALVWFAGASIVGAAVIIGALAYGEDWTDPRLFCWALAVEATSNFCACMIVNACAGVVARPASRHRRLEAAATSGCVAIQLAVTFRAAIWSAFTGHSAESLGAVAMLTAGAAVIATVAALVVTTDDGHRRLGVKA